jgi:uncharacterized protein
LSQEERDKRLLQAAKGGQVRRMKLLIDAHANVDYHGPGGDTALHKAVEGDYLDCVELLLHSGADINARGKCRDTALCRAAEHGNGPVVNCLIEKRADLNIVDDVMHISPLCRAVIEGHVEVVKLLIATCRVDLESKDPLNNFTPLLYAAKYGHQVVVDLLIEAGANIDAWDRLGPRYLDLLKLNSRFRRGSLQRLNKDLRDIVRDPPSFCSAGVIGDDLVSGFTPSTI